MSAISFMHTNAEPAELVYERCPGWIEGWERVRLIRNKTGTRVVMEGHNFRYDLEPTTFVLEGITRALQRFTPDQIERGEVVIGTRGLKVLERYAPRLMFLSLERSATRGVRA